MNTALAPYTPTDFRSAIAIAERLANSGMLPGIRNADQAFAIMATGAEMGLGPMLSLRSIVMVNGKPTLSAELMLRLVIENGVKHHWVHTDNDRAELRLTRDGHEPFFSKFSIDDARRAGLLKKPGPWHQYPANMCRARVISNGVRAYCPDLLTGVYVTGELDDVPRGDAPMQDLTPPAEPELSKPWTTAQQKLFLKGLHDVTATADDGTGSLPADSLEGWLEFKGRPRLSVMTEETRDKVLAYLGGEGLEVVWAWVAANEDSGDGVPDAEFEEVDEDPEAPASLVKLWEAIELTTGEIDDTEAAVNLAGEFGLDLSGPGGLRGITDEHALEHYRAKLAALLLTEAPC